MPLYTGQHGIVRHNPNYDGTGSSLTSALQVRNWQVNLVSPTIDTTTLGQTWVTKIPSTRSCTGTCEINYYRTPTDNDSTASNWIDRLVDKQTADDVNYRVEFMLSRGSSSGRIQFEGFITNITMSCQVGEVVTVQATFESDGIVDSSF